MVKRKISLFLAVLMVLSVLTGCATNEIGYLNLSREINKLVQYEFKSSTQIEVSKAITNADKDTKIDLDIIGEANVEDLGSMYLNMYVKVKVNGAGNENPIKVLLTDNKFYVSKNVLLEAVKLQETLTGESDYNRDVVEKLLEELKDTEYIMLADVSEIYGSIKTGKNGYTEIYDSAEEYLKAAFKGFDSKLVTKTSKGYAVDINADSFADFTERLIKYISKNKELVFDETIKYMDKVFDILAVQGVEGITADEKDTAIAEIKEMRQDFYDFIDETAALVDSGEYKDVYVDFREMLDRSYLKGEIYKDGGKYGQNVQGELVYEDFIAGNIKSNTVMNPNTVKKISVTEKSISLEDLEALYTALENKYNPVERIVVNWYSYDEPGIGADISTYRTDGKYDWAYKPYVILEDRAYLPLRYIGETFGEDIQWDDVNKKAYVVRGSEKIDMTGILSDDLTMVKIRDFEKLGYSIEYYQEEGWSTAVISKTGN